MKIFKNILTLSLPVTRICVNYSTVYNDTLVAKGLNKKIFCSYTTCADKIHNKFFTDVIGNTKI